MKILAISNFYPPHHVSGYALLCADVLNALRDRGHEITVLTSTLGSGSETVDGRVHRVLALESPLDYYRPVAALRYPVARRRNLRHLRRLVAVTRPDVVFVWGMWNLSKRLAEEAERLPDTPVVYYLANPWPIEPNLHQAYWALATRRPWMGRVKRCCRLLARRVLRDEWRDVHLRFEHAPCCSGALRRQLLDAGVPLRDAPIIYEGIDLASHVTQGARRVPPDSEGILSVVYVGLLVRHKGVHTAIESLSKLPRATLARVRLTILGSGHPDYEEQLRTSVTAAGLDRHVTFEAPVARAALPGFLAKHHVLLLPSIWEEPLALIMQEGLANGMVVVGSATGGTTEIIRDGENGLLFAAEDANRLAAHLQRLAADPALCATLARNGQDTARALFGLGRMVDDVEAYLARACADPQPV
jgi:glycosyltransferase involved in cell wall biosynthesis